MSRWEPLEHGANLVLSRLELRCLRAGVAAQARGRIRLGCRRAAQRKRCRWLAHDGSTSRGHGRTVSCRFGQPSSWGACSRETRRIGGATLPGSSSEDAAHWRRTAHLPTPDHPLMQGMPAASCRLGRRAPVGAWFLRWGARSSRAALAGSLTRGYLRRLSGEVCDGNGQCCVG